MRCEHSTEEKNKASFSFDSLIYSFFFSYNVLTLLFGKTAAVAANHRQQQKPHQNQHDKWNLVPFHLGFVHSTCKALSISLSTFDLFDDLDWNEMRANKTKWEKKKNYERRGKMKKPSNLDGCYENDIEIYGLLNEAGPWRGMREKKFRLIFAVYDGSGEGGIKRRI